ncbi:site-specific integrase [Phosphitispora sp. TUW77]|uniref:site-specific integrase n=1 Tax=Phosphitispora sp. TUW77 TaxID=3152361 RepID=UPI003AB8E1BE
MNGSLQKKGNMWYAVISLEGKKQKWISTKTKDKNKAKVVLRDILTKMENDLYIDPTKVKFLDFMDDWLNLVISKEIEKTTLESYQLTYKSHIKPYFQKLNLSLSDLKTIHLQKYINEKHENGRRDGKGGLGGNTLRKHKILLKSCLDYAVKMRLIGKNPIDNVVLPKKDKFTGSYYNAEQIERLLEIVKNTPIETPVFLTVYYGFRRGEVLGLKWSDVDFKEGTITINNTRVRYSKVSVDKSPKTEKSRRTLPLMKLVSSYLKKLKLKLNNNKMAMGKDYQDNQYVCCWENGQLYSVSFINHKLTKLLSEYEMPHIRFHDLRHSTASFLLKQGFSLKEIQEWLGHADITTTANIYSHVDMEMKKNIANRLDTRFAI